MKVGTHDGTSLFGTCDSAGLYRIHTDANNRDIVNDESGVRSRRHAL